MKNIDLTNYTNTSTSYDWDTKISTYKDYDNNAMCIVKYNRKDDTIINFVIWSIYDNNLIKNI